MLQKFVQLLLPALVHLFGWLNPLVFAVPVGFAPQGDSGFKTLVLAVFRDSQENRVPVGFFLDFEVKGDALAPLLDDFLLYNELFFHVVVPTISQI